MDCVISPLKSFIRTHADFEALTEKSWFNWACTKIDAIKGHQVDNDSLFIRVNTLWFCTIALSLDVATHGGKAVLNCCRLDPKNAGNEIKKCCNAFLVYLALLCLTPPSHESHSSSKPISAAELEKELDSWLDNPTASGMKTEAKARILKAFNNKETVLDLAYLELNTLPSSIRYLTQLKELDLSHNLLKTIPENFFDSFNSLEYLWISKSQLEVIPENLFDSLQKLKSLRLDENNLVELPKDIFKYLVNLEDLNLSSNSLAEFSKNLFEFTKNIKELVLSYNKIKSFPEDFFKPLVKLQVVYLQEIPIASGLINQFPPNTIIHY